MNKIEYILFIFEGVKTEPLIFNNLKKYFLKKKENNVNQEIIISYGTVIYNLYKKFFIDDILDEDLDLVTLLNLKDKENNPIKVTQVPEIYLFFDYDSHASNATDEKLINMLKLFDNESEKGKLYISYPMVESLLHVRKNINFHETIEKSEKKYKKIARQNCDEEFLHFNDYILETWEYLIKVHSKKANFIVNDIYVYPEKILEQFNIFLNQKQKYIELSGKVSVLSSFPLFLLDYYGVSKFR